MVTVSQNSKFSTHLIFKPTSESLNLQYSHCNNLIGKQESYLMDECFEWSMYHAFVPALL